MRFVSFLLALIGALIILVVGWLIATLVKYFIFLIFVQAAAQKFTGRIRRKRHSRRAKIIARRSFFG